jgi:alpha-mannosidase
MTIRRASVILPCHGFDDFPTHLAGPVAADLLAAITALWHPALIHATHELPGWYPSDELPDPDQLEGELIVIPSASRERMAVDWPDRVRATAPRNPTPIEAAPSRSDTVAALLTAAQIDPGMVRPESVADFLALGYAHMQVELLTQALRYTSVLDSDQFAGALFSAVEATVAGNHEKEQEELNRAFDLLSDARNHVYSVDFYVIDLTLLAESTLGESLRAKLALGSRTNLLITGEQIERIAREFPQTFGELKRALDAGTAALVGGRYRSTTSECGTPETLLSEVLACQRVAREHLGRDFEVYGQFSTDFSPLLPALLKNLGFRGALYAGFDGGPLPKPDQRKTNWGSHDAKIEALATMPLDASRPESWIKLAEQIGDTIAHDHVATILLAAWPGTECEYFDDVRRASRFGNVLGKLVTLDEYFHETRQADDWTNFHPRDYPTRAGADSGPNPISTRVASYREGVRGVRDRLGASLTALAGFSASGAAESNPSKMVAINPWNIASTQAIGSNALSIESSPSTPSSAPPLCLPDVPGCGFASLASAAAPPAKPLADELTLRTERFELTVSKKTGGIQSLRTNRDRNTRVSQRLVFHHQLGEEPAQTQMVADKVAISRNDSVVGEITSRGRVLGPAGDVVAKFAQRVRAVRGVPAAIVDVELEPQHAPAGDIWKSYFGSRLAWSEEALAIRCGRNWGGFETTRERIESQEWVEIDDGIGKIICFPLGLPFHRMAGPQWLDTLFIAAGEEGRRFQFAIGIDQSYLTHASVALLSSCDPYRCVSPAPLATPRGWFLHIGAKNVLCTHIEPLTEPAAGIRVRLLETEGRDTQTTLAAFRPLKAAWTSDFRGNRTDVLSIADGNASIDLSSNGWVQIEAEW